MRQNRKLRSTILLITAVMTGVIATAAVTSGQTPSPTPAAEVTLGGYDVTASTEVGWRWRRVEGSENKYKSDLNYKAGFRSFDTNLLFEAADGKGKLFDSLLISVTGWGADPTGATRFNAEKIGFYKLDVNARRVQYFNNLVNHALNEHNQNTSHHFGDFDLTLLPQNRLIRFLIGGSYNTTRGQGMTTTRAYSDEFPINSFARTRANDFRFGAEGKVFDFDWGLTQGFRVFKDRSSFQIDAPAPGNNPTNTAALATFLREFPTKGNVSYTQFNLHRTFGGKLDFTGRGIYSNTDSVMSLFETITGRDNSNNFVDLDRFTISSGSKRVQKRGDFGITYMVNENLRFSNSLSIDEFTVNGGENFEEALFRRNAAGSPLATTTTRSTGYRVNDYQRVVNTLEGDYQVNNKVGFHIGYRYTHRRSEVAGIDTTHTSPTSATNPLFITEEEENSTNALIAGMKLKPAKNWVIFADIEKGTADNVFTRVENYKYTNFRIRSRLTLNKFNLNVSAITKDNTNPSFNIVNPLALNFTTNVVSRHLSGSLDWTPADNVSFSGGYTYRHLTSFTPIIVPISGTLTNGTSEYFARDHFAYAEVNVRPFKRISIYAAYRISRDKGQGDRFSALLQNLITSYPMQFQSPEIRAAIRLSDNIDWNIGYQYYNYKDSQAPLQNYRAHLPYTSLRIYFGRRAADRQ